MTKATPIDQDENANDVQNELLDVINLSSEIESDLSCAESCETVEDLIANIQCALENARQLVEGLEEHEGQLLRGKDTK